MSDTASEGGRNSLTGIIGFIVIVAIWTGINHWRQNSSIQSQCEDQNLGEVFCTCFKKEMMSEIGIMSSVPIVGGFIKSDEKWSASQDQANAICLAGGRT
ncbi:MAG: hypothetical protein AAGH90_12340 [Pseudomonadota bacterium]